MLRKIMNRSVQRLGGKTAVAPQPVVQPEVKAKYYKIPVISKRPAD